MATDPIKQLYSDRKHALIEKIKSYKMPRDNFQASELGGCKRAIWYRRMGFIPAARTPRGEDYGNDGDMHHDQVRTILRDAGIKLSGLQWKADGRVAETRSHLLRIKHKDGPIDIGMRLDGFIHFGNRKYVLEIKSLGFWKNKPIREIWEKTGSVANVLEYIMENRKDIMYQTHACMVAEKCKRTYVLFKDRSECAIGLHSYKDPDSVIGGPIIEFQQAIYDQMIRRLAVVTRCLKTGQPPRAEFLASSKECGYCNHFHLCHGADKRKKQNKTPYALHPQLGRKIHVKDLR